jgi:hypothetical protein
VILPKDGTPLMVRKEYGWHPAVLLQSKGDDYTVRYIAKDAGQEAVSGERIRHLFAVKPNENIPMGLFRSK